MSTIRSPRSGDNHAGRVDTYLPNKITSHRGFVSPRVTHDNSHRSFTLLISFVADVSATGFPHVLGIRGCRPAPKRFGISLSLEAERLYSPDQKRFLVQFPSSKCMHVPKKKIERAPVHIRCFELRTFLKF